MKKIIFLSLLLLHTATAYADHGEWYRVVGGTAPSRGLFPSRQGIFYGTTAQIAAWAPSEVGVYIRNTDINRLCVSTNTVRGATALEADQSMACK